MSIRMDVQDCGKCAKLFFNGDFLSRRSGVKGTISQEEKNLLPILQTIGRKFPIMPFCQAVAFTVAIDDRIRICDNAA